MAKRKKKPFVVDDSTNNDLLFTEPRGLVPRDRSIYGPDFMRSPPTDMPVIDPSEWSARCKEQEEQESSLEHVFNRLAKRKGLAIPFLFQGRQGYCWAYSTGNATMLDRELRGLPYVRLNPHAVAAIIKHGADEGGWCGLSADFLEKVGIPSEEFWEPLSMNTRQDTPEMRANAGLHKLSESWIDLTASVYDRNLTTNQLASCLLSNIPCAVDYNEWGHSVCAGRWVEIEKGVFGPRILNSWAPGGQVWGDNGWGTINKSWDVDSAVALRVTGASPV